MQILDVSNALQAIIDLINSKRIMGIETQGIIDIVHGTSMVQRLDVLLTERQIQIIRFALLRALETI